MPCLCHFVNRRAMDAQKLLRYIVWNFAGVAAFTLGPVKKFHWDFVCSLAVSRMAAPDAAELQADWARSSFDNYISESSKITEMAVKTANEAAAPIPARVDGVVETLAENAS